MSKRAITRLWIIGLIVLVVGLIVGGTSLGLMFANGGHFTPSVNGNGSDFVPNLDTFFWTTMTVAAAGFLVALVGVIMQIAAWIGALVNTNMLQDKTWFIVLLVGGILGLGHGLIGFAVMIAYLVAGPDGTVAQQSQPPLPSDFRPSTMTSLG